MEQKDYVFFGCSWINNIWFNSIFASCTAQVAEWLAQKKKGSLIPYWPGASDWGSLDIVFTSGRSTRPTFCYMFLINIIIHNIKKKVASDEKDEIGINNEDKPIVHSSHRQKHR